MAFLLSSSHQDSGSDTDHLLAVFSHTKACTSDTNRPRYSLLVLLLVAAEEDDGDDNDEEDDQQDDDQHCNQGTQ